MLKIGLLNYCVDHNVDHIAGKADQYCSQQDQRIFLAHFLGLGIQLRRCSPLHRQYLFRNLSCSFFLMRSQRRYFLPPAKKPEPSHSLWLCYILVQHRFPALYQKPVRIVVRPGNVPQIPLRDQLP